MASEVKLTYELPSQEQNGRDCELKTSVNKEVFERWTKAVHCHYIETRFEAKPMHKRDTNPSLKCLIDEELVLKGVIISFLRLEFENDGLVI